MLHPAGKVRIYQFRGEESGNTVHVLELKKNEAAYIEQGERHCCSSSSSLMHFQCSSSSPSCHPINGPHTSLVSLPAFSSLPSPPAGSVHFVQNAGSGGAKARFLQLFDHPKAGTVFVAPALAALADKAPEVVNSAFSEPVFAHGTTGKPGIIRVAGCGV